MRVLAAMSGGVDSSVAAALLVAEGHDVVGVTLKLWDNPGQGGCCSVVEIEDARRVAQQLGIDHWVFAFTEEFEARVVAPYAEAHAAGRTPNPCIECNRHLKFGRLLARARQLGFDAVATGHHARVRRPPEGGEWELLRGADPAKDQSYVLYVLGQEELARCLFPVGELTKAEVRETARRLGLRTAAKPDSQEVCFVTTAGGREALLAGRIALHPGRVVDAAGAEVGRVGAVELVTVGQRRGLGLPGGGGRRFALDVDPGAATVTVGTLDDLLCDRVELTDVCWTGAERGDGGVDVQTTAHGDPVAGRLAGGSCVIFDRPARRVAPGQSVVLYRGERVLGGGMAAR